MKGPQLLNYFIGQDFRQFLNREFKLKDPGLLSYFVGLEVFSDAKGYYMSQAKHACDLVS